MTLRVAVFSLTIMLCCGISVGASAQPQPVTVTCTDLPIPEYYTEQVYWLDDHTVAFDNFNYLSIGALGTPIYRWYTYNMLTDTLSVFSEWQPPQGAIPRELMGTRPNSPSPFSAMPLPPELVGVIPHSEETMRDIRYLSSEQAYIFPRRVDDNRVRLWYLDRQTGMQTDLGIELYRIFPKVAFWSADGRRAILGHGDDYGISDAPPYNRSYLLTIRGTSVTVEEPAQFPEWQAENHHVIGFSVFALSLDGNDIFILTTFGRRLVFSLTTRTWRSLAEIPDPGDLWINNNEYITVTPERTLERVNLQTNTSSVLASGDALYPLLSQGRAYRTFWSPRREYYFARWRMPLRADQHLEDIGYIVCRVPWVNALITATQTPDAPPPG